MGASRFQRFVLPAFAFKAVVIGGAYATGRELAEYLSPAGPLGGLMGMAPAAVYWSVVCAVTFMVAQATRSLDYRSFSPICLAAPALSSNWPIIFSCWSR